jgi:hypothetical protein
MSAPEVLKDLYVDELMDLERSDAAYGEEARHERQGRAAEGSAQPLEGRDRTFMP